MANLNLDFQHEFMTPPRPVIDLTTQEDNSPRSVAFSDDEQEAIRFLIEAHNASVMREDPMDVDMLITPGAPFRPRRLRRPLFAPIPYNGEVIDHTGDADNELDNVSLATQSPPSFWDRLNFNRPLSPLTVRFEMNDLTDSE
jgi:hypothetical protein